MMTTKENNVFQVRSGKSANRSSCFATTTLRIANGVRPAASWASNDGASLQITRNSPFSLSLDSKLNAVAITTSTEGTFEAQNRGSIATSQATVEAQGFEIKSNRVTKFTNNVAVATTDNSFKATGTSTFGGSTIINPIKGALKIAGKTGTIATIAPTQQALRLAA